MTIFAKRGKLADFQPFQRNSSSGLLLAGKRIRPGTGVVRQHERQYTELVENRQDFLLSYQLLLAIASYHGWQNAEQDISR